jgi:integrase
MSLYKRGDTWWMEFTKNGRRWRKSTGLSNRREAQKIEDAFKTQIERGEVGIEDQGPAPTLREFAQQFADFISTRHAAKPQTIDFYAKKLKQVLRYEPLREMRLDRIDEAIVERYIVWRRRSVSATSVNRELATLRRLLNVAKEWKVIKSVPKIRLLSGERQRDFVLSHQEEQRYLDAAPEPLKTVAVLLLDTGLRVGEALNLRKDDVHIEPAGGARYGWVHVREGKSKNAKRNVPMTGRVSAAVKPLLIANTSQWLFPGDSPDRAILPTSLAHIHTRVCRPLERVGKKLVRKQVFPKEFVIHSARHTCLTRLGEAGADAFTIMKLAGHSSVTVSQRYVHPTPEAVERAFERLEALNRLALAAPAR